MTASNDEAGALALVRRLIAHAAWADGLLWDTLEQQHDVPSLDWQEYSAPAPVDYISFVRGVAAAVTPPPFR